MPRTAADIRNVILLTVATFAAACLLAYPDGVVIALPLAGFSLGWLYYRFGLRASALVSIGAGLFVLIVKPFGTQPANAAYVTAVLLAVGPAAAWGLRRYSAWTVMAGVCLASAAAFLVSPLGGVALAGAVETTRLLLQAAASSGSVADTAALSAAISTTAVQTRMYWPATVVILFAFGASVTIPLVSRAGRSLGQQVHRYPALADVDLTFHLVWPSIAGLALLAGGTIWGGGKGLVYVIGCNTLMIVRPALALQGLAVFASLYRRIGAGRVWRGFGYVLLVLTELVIPSVSVIGVVDLFFNLRKLPRTGAVAQEL